jgi:hypothetical protein
LRGLRLAGKEFNKRGRFLFPREGKLEAGRSLEFTEGIGLILPLEIPETARIVLQMMFGFLMIREHFVKRGFPFRSFHNEP